MEFLQDNAWPWLVVALLLVLCLLLGAVVVVLYIQKKSAVSKYMETLEEIKVYRSRNNKEVKDFYQLRKEKDQLRKEKDQLCKEKDQLRKEYFQIFNEYNQKRNNLAEAEVVISKLNEKIADLNRNNAELNKLLDKQNTKVEVKEDVTKVSSNDSEKKLDTPVVTIVEPERPKEGSIANVSKEVIIYSSFPRSAGSSVYFSDLTENLADDSYFEIKISNTSGKATFKPLDFMKIRNFDAAWNAMISEGVKPAAATTVCGIEPGKAHKDGNDLIVDNPAIIKLA